MPRALPPCKVGKFRFKFNNAVRAYTRGGKCMKNTVRNRTKYPQAAVLTAAQKRAATIAARAAAAPTRRSSRRR